MKLRKLINIKKSCRMIAFECDLTDVLATLRKRGYERITVKPFTTGNAWQVLIRTTADRWYEDLYEVRKNSEHEIRVPLKDVFGETIYHEA